MDSDQLTSKKPAGQDLDFRSQLIRIHTVFHSACKYTLITMKIYYGVNPELDSLSYFSKEV